MTNEMVVLRDGTTVRKDLADERLKALEDLEWQSYTAFRELAQAAFDSDHVISEESAQFLVDWVVIDFDGTAIIDDPARAIIKNAVNREGVVWEVQSPFKEQ